MKNVRLTDLQLSQLSKLAYEPNRKKIESQLAIWFPPTCPTPLKAIHHIYVKRTDTEGFAVVIGDQLIMVGTGTDSLKDMLIDLCAWRIPFWLNGLKVSLHRGFVKVHEDLEEEVYKILYDPSISNLLNNQEIKQITYTGHSLGSIVAQSLAIHTSKFGFLKKIPKRICVDGCPGGWSKSGAAEMSRLFPDFIRYKNTNDPVTWIPASSSWPGKARKLKGKWGHSVKKYIHNKRKLFG